MIRQQILEQSNDPKFLDFLLYDFKQLYEQAGDRTILGRDEILKDFLPSLLTGPISEVHGYGLGCLAQVSTNDLKAAFIGSRSAHEVETDARNLLRRAGLSEEEISRSVDDLMEWFRVVERYHYELDAIFAKLPSGREAGALLTLAVLRL
jgi:hypothetical protein